MFLFCNLKIKYCSWDLAIAQSVNFLSGMHKMLGLIFTLKKADVVIHAYDPSIPEVEAGESGVTYQVQG